MRLRTTSAAAAAGGDSRLPKPFSEANQSFEALVLSWGRDAATRPNMYADKVRENVNRVLPSSHDGKWSMSMTIIITMNDYLTCSFFLCSGDGLARLL